MNKYLLLACFIYTTISGFSQDLAKQQLTLERIIDLAKNQSPASLRAETRRENRYWQYRTFRSNYKPQVILNGSLPNYECEVNGVIQEDGSTEYRFVNQNNSFMELTLSQTISATGAEVFLSSNLNRFDNFDTGDKRYSGNPVFLGFRQPLFTFNELSWDKKIEPLRYEESQREYVEDLEEIAIEATQRFFNRLLAQISFNIAEIDLANNDTIFQIAQGRYNLGKIAENELLQLELTLMNSRQRLAQAELDLETTTLALQAFVGFTGDFTFDLVVPDDLPDFNVDPDRAIEYALTFRQEAVEFERQVLEAERDVASARAQSGLNASLYASFGLTNTGNSVGDVYQEPDNQQSARVGFNIPIIDWGRTKSRVKTAEASQKLIEYTVEQNRILFEQEIYTQVRQFEMLKNQVEITTTADEIAQKRYDISKNRYLIGKIGITDLNIALQEKNAAKQNYVAALLSFWQAYFNLRRLTLYDFYADRPLYQPSS